MKHFKQLFAVTTMTLVLSVAVFSQSTYTQFGKLNMGAVNVPSTWVKLTTTTSSHTFTKASSTSKIEVHVNSRFTVGALNSAGGIRFQVRVDNITPTFGNEGSILTANTSAFLSLYTVFENIPAGNHTVSLWAQVAPSGTASSVIVDTKGWGGMIIVKETQ